MKKIYLLAAAAALVFMACSKDKDESDNQPTPDAGAVALYNKVQGKWTFEGLVLQGRKSAGSSFARKAPVMAREADQDAVGFIEFTSDSTYILTDSEGHFFSGTFLAKDSATISLGDYATLNNITFVQSAINFTLQYRANSNQVSVVANKAAAIPASDSTTLLCRKWYLTKNESGAAFFESELSDTTGADSLTLQMTSAGTYFVQNFRNKKLMEADAMNWKWHSKKPNQFVYWYPEEIVLNEDDNSVVIRELNKNVFKAFEKDDLNRDGKIADDEGWYWDFRPVAK